LADASDVVVVCCSGDIKGREEREGKEGILGWTGLTGVWVYEGLCFQEGDLLDEEQQRFIFGQEPDEKRAKFS